MIEFKVNYPEVGKTYMKRIGAYALISNEKNLLAIVKQVLVTFYLVAELKKMKHLRIVYRENVSRR